jgi:HSP20 family protein
MAIDRWRPGRSLMRGPFRDLGRMEREVEDLFGRFFREFPFPRLFGEGRGVAPAVDLLDKKDAVILRADLPGLNQRDIEVNVEEGFLTIRGERKGEETVKEEDYYCCERWAGSFERSLALPSGVDAEKIRATFKQGVLEVRLPKVEKAKGKKIEIKGE